MKEKLKVMLTTEGTYPFHQGGVSTWCDILVNGLDSVDYTIYSVLMDPFVTQKFELPETVSLIKMPLWGTEEPSEHLTTPFSQTFLSKKRTTTTKINQHFIPLFEELIKEIIAPVKNPKRLAHIMLELHLYFQYYEYKVSFKSEEAWEAYKQIIMNYVLLKGSHLARPDIYCLIQSLGWIYRFMNILNTPVPDVDVTHSTAAAFCGIPCVLAKMKNKTPFMLTEHGVYLREQYLYLSKREYSTFLNTFLIRLVHSITSLNYAYADQVSPVCIYNTRWEREFGIPNEKIKVIYNGIDKNVFLHAAGQKPSHPTVVTTARIDPIKDIEMLIQAAALVKKQIPDVRFMIYGSISVPKYYEQCLELRKKLGLDETVIFAGHTTNIVSAYKSGDLVALTSISEAFPYSVLEAMMAGRAVVSTDVGGIKEALGDTGVLVPARNHEKLAEEITRLLNTPELRIALANEAQERALALFTIDKVLQNHLDSYLVLINGFVQPFKQKSIVAKGRGEVAAESFNISGQRIWMERGLASKVAGYFEQAIYCFRSAIEVYPASKVVPVLLLELAQIYNHLGQYDLAFQEIEKYNIYHEILIMSADEMLSVEAACAYEERVLVDTVNDLPQANRNRQEELSALNESPPVLQSALNQANGKTKDVPCGKLIPDENEQDIFFIIKAGFDARSMGNTAFALGLFIRGLDYSHDPQLSLLIAKEISDIYKEVGQYSLAATILKSLADSGLGLSLIERQVLLEHAVFLEQMDIN